MTILENCVQLLANVRRQRPLVHHLTNYVTVNDCANVTLAIGGSPVMADDVEEAGEMAAIASSVVLNIGTLNTRTIGSMLAAGKTANGKGAPVVFDPVGAGATILRNTTTARILDEVKVAVLRGNISEIRSVAGLAAHTKGVDADSVDGDVDSGSLAADLARKLRCVVAITGARDAISDSKKIVFVENGHAMLADISGTGCMCSSLVGAFVGATPDQPLLGAAAAILCMGVAGEVAFQKAGSLGTGSYHAAIMDAISRMDESILLEKGQISEADY